MIVYSLKTMNPKQMSSFVAKNKFRMIEFPLMPVYPADLAVKTAIQLTSAVVKLESQFLKQMSSFVVEMSLEWLNNLSYQYILLQYSLTK